MKTGLLSLLAGTALLGGVTIAQADEVKTLTDSQMDGVVAGVVVAGTQAGSLSSGIISASTSATSGFGLLGAASLSTSQSGLFIFP